VTQSNRIAEIVSFQLAEGVVDADFLETLSRSAEFVSSAPGYITRDVCRDDEGRWTDRVIWADMDSAKAAQAAFMSQDFVPDILNAIDRESFVISHQPVLWSNGAPRGG